MNLKKIKFFGVFIAFLICFPLHFLYNWIPNSILSIFVPVNESIWEHMKLIFTSFLLYGLLEYFVLYKFKIETNNYLLQLSLIPVLGIIVYLALYLPIYHLIGENMIFSIGLLFIVIIFEQLLSYHFLTEKKIIYQEIIGVFGIIITFIVFGFLTYNPPIDELFYDATHQKYGLHTYAKE